MANYRSAHLLCSIGTGDYKPIPYRLGDEIHTSPFAPVALAHLLGLRGGKASVLVTREARAKWYPDLAEELRRGELDPQPVEMPQGRTEEEIFEAVHQVLAVVKEGENVVLDVTFSLRHLPFVYLAALVYLTAYRKAVIKGIFYGAYELRQTANGEAPILDVTPLFRLTQWYHAVQTAQESGDLRAMAQMLSDDVAHLFQTGLGDRSLSRAKDCVKRLAPPTAAGLPLEAGLAAQGLRAALSGFEQHSEPRQVGHFSLDVVTHWLEEWALPETAGSKKGDLVLSDDVLRRLLQLARWYADRNDVPKALLLLREWLVSLFVLRRGEPGRWLEREHREAITGYLNALPQRSRYHVATDAEQRVARIWNKVAYERNKYAHAGFRPDDVMVDSNGVTCLVDTCKKLLDEEELSNLPKPGSLRLLVTPLGLAPGVIYSAVHHIQPDRMLVVTSAIGRQRLKEALEKAGRTHVPCLVREVAEPHTGFQEATSLIDDEVSGWLVKSGEVVVNLTGGTTVLQYIAEQVADRAHKLGVQVRRIALVDRRPPVEQGQDPYVRGELVNLDPTREYPQIS